MGTDTHANNKRIAKNTALLYFRMIVTTLVSLYTARLLLQLLGVEDFGINNVVGGVVTFMSFINGTMTSATQRFLAFDLGRNNIDQFRKTYSMIINVFIMLCILIFIVLECVGPWFVANKMVIPADRLVAAQYVFQFSLISFLFSTMTIPFHSSIVAYEKMGIYAYFTFIDVAAKLLICYLLYITPIDKLITYGAFNMFVTFVIMSINYLYCRKKLVGCNYSWQWDKSLFSKLGKYAGWNLFGSISAVLCSQGQSIILNLFFGPIVNAAKAVADKINSIVMTFSTNFYMAVNPQIIKTYAAGQIDYTRKLVTNSSRYSFYLLSIISFPLILNMDSILNLWLGESQVSNVMVRFAQLELIKSLVVVLENPITMAIRATGDIKRYQIIVGIQTLMFLPICYVAFTLGMPAYGSMLILAVIFFFVQITRVFLVRNVINLSFISYLKSVICPIAITTVLSVIFSYVTIQFLNDSLYMFLLKVIITILISAFFILLLGLKSEERSYLMLFLKKRIHLIFDHR